MVFIPLLFLLRLLVSSFLFFFFFFSPFLSRVLFLFFLFFSVFSFILIYFFPIDLSLTCVCVVIGTTCNIYVVVFSGWQAA